MMTLSQVSTQPHQPVLISALLEKLPPIRGVWLDCTFGAGGYTKALLEAGAQKIIALDRDPEVIAQGAKLKTLYGSKLEICEAKFSALDSVVKKLDLTSIAGIIFDVGVSSMQIDKACRGFSFQKDGPLDMRMSQKGITASDIVNNASEEELADIIYFYGEDRSARAIARAIVNERVKQKIASTEHLSRIVKTVVRRSNLKNKKKFNPATRTFQALRIAVNDELEELNAGLLAAEHILNKGALLAVVSFHSLEDRLVKQFLLSRSSDSSGQSRYLPSKPTVPPTFKKLFNKVIRPSIDEISKNSRARSAKLRVAVKLSSDDIKNSVSRVEFPRVKFFAGNV